MTIEPDLDFRVATWLDDQATSQVPETLLERSLARVEGTRQRPGWLARPVGPERVWRRGSLRVVAVGAAALAVLAIWFASIGGGPSPSPTPSPTTASSAVPPSLRATWVGPTRTPPPGVSGVTQYAFTVSSAELQFHGGGPHPILRSAAAFMDDTRLTFRLKADEAGCRRDDLGIYSFALNPTNRALTLDVETETCAARAALIAGSWTRADCPNRSSLCLGDLDAGQHSSAQFNPFVPRDAYVYDYGRLTYTVPDSWSNATDGPDGFSLAEQGSPLAGAINLFSTAIAVSQGAGCPGTPEPGVAAGAEALSTWLTTLPGLAASTPSPVSVGGLSGFTVDVTVKPAWTRTCPFSGGKPYVPLFTNGLAGDVNFDWGLAAGGKMRLFLLDLPDGRTTLIDVEAPDEATWDAFVAAAEPIVESFQYHP